MSYKQIEQETKMIISNKNNENNKTEAAMNVEAYIYSYDMTDSDNLEIFETPRGMKYSILKDEPDGTSEYVLYSGEEPPALYSAGLPDAVRKLRVMLDDFMDGDGLMNQDAVVHCSRECFSLLIQADITQ